MANEAESSGETRTSVAFAYELQDFILAYRLSTQPNAKRAALMIAAILALFAALFWCEPDRNSRLAAGFGGLLGGLAVFLLHRHVYLPLYARRMFANYPMMRSQHTFAFEPDGIRNSTERTNAFLIWRDFVGWRANDTSVLLYTSPRQFILVPTRLAAQGFPIEQLKCALARDFAMRR